MLRRILKCVALTVACLVVATLSSALLYRKYLQHKVAQERAITSPAGINSLERVRIGGIDQWIQVRGQDVNNPILLFIHGGPGIAFIPLAGAFQRPWEKWFTIVQWDQRGAGKTYTSNNKEGLRRTMTLPRMEQDTLEVAHYLRNRFHREKIFVVGHSWGSVLGLWLAHEHPELLYAYVGVEQVINTEQNNAMAYRDALQLARSRHHEAAVKDLESIAPYPSPNPASEKEEIARSWEGELLGPRLNRAGFADVGRILLDLVSAPDYSLLDDYSFIRGLSLSAEVLFPAVAKIDLEKLGPDFRAPLFFFEGRQDPYCRPALVWEYFQSIQAPHKEFIWFEDSGHFPFFEEPERFTNELVQRIWHLARSGRR